MAYKTLDDFDLKGKRVLIRQDLNVPVSEGNITSDARLRAALPSLKRLLDGGASLIVMSHLGRPQEGRYDASLSLAPIAQYLAEALNQEVALAKDWQADGLPDAPVCLLENVRFNVGEKSNDDELGQAYAQLCDLYVMDAFGTAHRAQASTHSVGLHAQHACAGPLMAAELHALETALNQPEKPMLAIVGGSKVSNKLAVLESLVDKVDQLIVGGGIANTFLAASGVDVGKSLYEPDLVDLAKNLMSRCSIPLPIDVVVATEFSNTAEATIKAVADISSQDQVLDVGPETRALFAQYIGDAATILWNGPVGVFEFDAFAGGTESMTKAIAQSTAFSVAGGGDTLAAIDKYDVAADISYISTGGGAFLEFVEGKILPAVAMLEQRGAN